MRRPAALALLLVALAAAAWVLLDAGSLLPGGGRDEDRGDGGDVEEGLAAGAAEEEDGGPSLEGRPLREVDLAEVGDAGASGGAEAGAVRAALPQGDLAAVVRDAEGRPVAGVRVTVFGEVNGELVSAQAVTDDEGRFRTRLPYGRYDLLLTSGTGGLFVADFLLDAASGRGASFTLEAVARLDVEVLRGGSPLAGATVALVRTTATSRVTFPGTALTSSAGLAVLDAVPRGKYVLAVATPEGWTAERGVEVIEDLSVRIEAPDLATLAGRVTDAGSGAPVAGASLVVEARGGGLVLRATALAGPDGAYVLAAPRAPPSNLVVQAGGYAPWPPADRLGPALRPLRPLAAGTPVTLDVALEAGASVSGLVTEAEGGPVRALVLRFSDRRGRTAVAASGEDGRYAVPNLNPGRYEASIVTPGWHATAALRVDVPAEGGATLDVVVQRARTVSGVVVHAGGAPAAGARVSVAGAGGLLRSLRDAGRFLETFSGADGSWALADVPADRAVWVRASLGPLEATPLLSRADVAEPPPLRLELAPTGTVRGWVVDLGTRDRVPGATVRVEPVGDPPVRGGRTTTTDARGEYLVEGLIGGAWNLTPVRGNEFLPAEPVSVTVGPGALEHTQELRLDPGLVLAGVVVDQVGRGVPGARVHAEGTPAGGKPTSRAATTDARGEFRITGLTSGAWRVRGWAKGYRGATIENLRGGEERLRLVLVLVP